MCYIVTDIVMEVSAYMDPVPNKVFSPVVTVLHRLVKGEAVQVQVFCQVYCIVKYKFITKVYNRIKYSTVEYR